MYTNLISTDELAVNLHNPNWVLVDCRFDLQDKPWGEEEYAQFHIPGAVYPTKIETSPVLSLQIPAAIPCRIPMSLSKPFADLESTTPTRWWFMTPLPAAWLPVYGLC